MQELSGVRQKREFAFNCIREEICCERVVVSML
jgi:hypothetical protein